MWKHHVNLLLQSFRSVSFLFTWCFHKQNYYIFYRHANIQRTYINYLLIELKIFGYFDQLKNRYARRTCICEYSATMKGPICLDCNSNRQLNALSTSALPLISKIVWLKVGCMIRAQCDLMG